MCGGMRRGTRRYAEVRGGAQRYAEVRIKNSFTSQKNKYIPVRQLFTIKKIFI